MEKETKKILITTVVLTVVISSVAGGAMGFWAGSAVNSEGFLGVINQALTGKDNTKNDLETPPQVDSHFSHLLDM